MTKLALLLFLFFGVLSCENGKRSHEPTKSNTTQTQNEPTHEPTKSNTTQTQEEDVLPETELADLTALFKIINSNNLEDVKSYINNHPDDLHHKNNGHSVASMDIEGSTPLLFALNDRNNLPIALYLINKGANPFTQTYNGYSSLNKLFMIQGVDTDAMRKLVSEIFDKMKKKKEFLAEIKRVVNDQSLFDLAVQYQSWTKESMKFFLDLLRPYNIESKAHCGVVHEMLNMVAGGRDTQLRLDALKEEYPQYFKSEVLNNLPSDCKDYFDIVIPLYDFGAFQFLINNHVNLPKKTTFCLLIKNAAVLGREAHDRDNAQKIFDALLTQGADPNEACSFLAGKMTFKERLQDLTSGGLATGVYHDAQPLFNAWKIELQKAGL